MHLHLSWIAGLRCSSFINSGWLRWCCISFITVVSDSFQGDAKKALVLNEVLKTEEDYVEDLGAILGVYKTPLLTQGLITHEQCNVLFANVHELLELNKEQMLEPLHARFAAAHENGLPLSTVKLGDLFITLSEHLKAYTEYCANQPNALAMLKHLKEENGEFSNFDAELQANHSQIRGLDMLAFIIKPVQRLCKYPLLIRELISTTDKEDEEYERLSVRIVLFALICLIN